MINKYKLKFIIFDILLCMILLLTACSESIKKIESLPNVSVGDEFEIVLDAYSGTPYVWSYEIKPNSRIEYVTKEFIPTDNNPDLIGGGQLKYTFKATQSGAVEITFQLYHLGESNSVTKTNIYKITIFEARGYNL